MIYKDNPLTLVQCNVTTHPHHCQYSFLCKSPAALDKWWNYPWLCTSVVIVEGLCSHHMPVRKFNTNFTTEGTKENKRKADPVVSKSVWEIHHLSLWGSAVRLWSCSSLSLTLISIWVSHILPFPRPLWQQWLWKERILRGRTWVYSLFMLKATVEKGGQYTGVFVSLINVGVSVLTS